MYPQHAIVFALDAILHVVVDPDGYRWEFDPRLPGLLRDCRATGHHVFGLLDPTTYGLELETEEERNELAAYLNATLLRAGAPPLDAIHIGTDLSDPAPLWQWRRKFGFSLANVTIVGAGPVYENLRHNAGIVTGKYWSPRSPEELFTHSALGF